MRVGYILKMFPRLSETFILSELLQLERQGADVSVFSLMHPNDGRFHGRLADLRLAAEYFPSDRPESAWKAVRSLPERLAVPFERWQEAADFLRRFSIPRDLELLLRAALIAAQVRERGIQHLHAHFATVATRMAALVSMLTGIPFSFTAHAKDIFRNGVDRELFSELIRRSSFAVTVSDFNRDFILQYTPNVQSEKVFRLYNGIDLDFFDCTRRTDDSGVPHIISVGRLVPKKGFDHLLRSLRRCKSDGMRFRATLVGDGEQRQALQNLRDELELGDEVSFTGGLAQEQVRELLSSSTVMALACIRDDGGNMDALPTVMLEALALDVPVVSTRLAGIPEIVGQDGGVLVEPGDDDGFADALHAVIEEVRRGDRRDGVRRRRAERLFDLKANVAELHAMFAGSARESRVA
jgi:glycosyltransferase involved in cell wall biosynthesis